MIVSSLILAGAMSAATIPEEAIQNMFEHYPRWAVLQGRSAAVLIEVIVEPDGEVRNCWIVEYVGSERLAEDRCDIFARQDLESAKGPEGQPILGLLRLETRAMVDGGGEEELAVREWSPPPRVTASLSADLDNPQGDVEVTVLVGIDGFIEMCERPSDKGDEASPALFEAACAEASAHSFYQLAKQDGEPSAYVTTVTVRFEAAES